MSENQNLDPYGVVAETDTRLRFHDVVKELQGAPQGDIVLIRVASHDRKDRNALQKLMQKGFGSDFRIGNLGNRTPERQLVSGTSIGSRHMIRAQDLDAVEIYRPDPQTASPLEGPSLVASRRFVVEHPEHAHHSLPEGCYIVMYSRNLASENLARIED